jgi:hypothetical protein
LNPNSSYKGNQLISLNYNTLDKYKELEKKIIINKEINMYTILNSKKTLNPVAKSQETKILNLTAKIKNKKS